MNTYTSIPEDPGDDPRVRALRQAAQRKHENALAQAEHGIRILIRDGGRISFKAVSRAAGVSTKFLHTTPDLADRIRTLARQQQGTDEQPHENSANGESAIIAALRRQLRSSHDNHKAEVTQLNSHIRRLEKQIAVLYGQLNA